MPLYTDALEAEEEIEHEDRYIYTRNAFYI